MDMIGTYASMDILLYNKYVCNEQYIYVSHALVTSMVHVQNLVPIDISRFAMHLAVILGVLLPSAVAKPVPS